MAVVGKGKKAIPFVSQLSDVACFSYATLCAVRLRYLYGDNPCDKKFCEGAIQIVLIHVGQPKQVVESVKAVWEGEGIDEEEPLVQQFLESPAVKEYGVMRVLEDLVTLSIKDGCYDARSRVFIHDVSGKLGIDEEQVHEFELSVVSRLHEEEHVMTEEEKKERDSKELKRKIKRGALIGLATVGGGVLLGVTGGLAAPVLAGGLGIFIGTAGATALASTAGVAVIGSLFGAAGAGLAGVKMNRRMGSLKEFEFERLGEGEDLHTTVAISGWLNELYPDFKSAWLGLDDSKEQFTLRFESEYMREMGKAMDYLMSIAVNMAVQEALKYTVLAGILAAIAWPMALVSAANVIDNPWHVCMQRSAQAGKQLAEVLLSRVQGKRPVNLIGFSLGARVIFYCLQEMAKRKNSEGIIQNVVMLGAPVPGDVAVWKTFSRVVAGRVVNGYSRGDWLLKFLYRTASVQLSIAGLGPVAWENRRMENVDFSELIEGHMDYMKKIDLLLDKLGIQTKEHLMQDWEVIEHQKKAADENGQQLITDPEYYSVAAVVRDTATAKADGAQQAPGKNQPKNEEYQLKNEEYHQLVASASKENLAKQKGTRENLGEGKKSDDKEAAVAVSKPEDLKDHSEANNGMSAPVKGKLSSSQENLVGVENSIGECGVELKKSASTTDLAQLKLPNSLQTLKDDSNRSNSLTNMKAIGGENVTHVTSSTVLATRKNLGDWTLSSSRENLAKERRSSQHKIHDLLKGGTDSNSGSKEKINEMNKASSKECIKKENHPQTKKSGADGEKVSSAAKRSDKSHGTMPTHSASNEKSSELNNNSGASTSRGTTK